MARSEPTRRVFLIGFMGAGKTSVGHALAARLGWKFRDLDDIIVAREHKSVAAIFAERGEAEFRQAESSALADLLQDDARTKNMVVALGGGTFVQQTNRDLLDRVQAITVLLEAPLEELRRRCTASGNVRPLASDEATFNKLFATRRAAYELAQHRVDTMGRTVDEVAGEIASILAVKPEVKQ